VRGCTLRLSRPLPARPSAHRMRLDVGTVDARSGRVRRAAFFGRPGTPRSHSSPLQRDLRDGDPVAMLLAHPVQLDHAPDEMLRARRRRQPRADSAVLGKHVLGLLLMKRPSQPAAYHRRQEVHDEEQRAHAPGHGAMRPCRPRSRPHTPGPGMKHMMPNAGLQHSTARPVGLSVRRRIFPTGTTIHAPLIKAS
jgi:hypothetical protein